MQKTLRERLKESMASASAAEPEEKDYFIVRMLDVPYLLSGRLTWLASDAPGRIFDKVMERCGGEIIETIHGTYEDAMLYCYEHSDRSGAKL